MVSIWSSFSRRFKKSIRRALEQEALMLAYEAFISGSEMEAYLWERIVIMSVEDIGMGEPECSRFMYAYCRVKDQLRTGPKRLGL